MDPFVGQLAVFPYNFAPINWLPCAGQIVAINQYTVLFSLIGNKFGGNGTTNFGLPDLRGRVPLGVGASTTGTNYLIGQKGGMDAVTLAASQVPVHNHSMRASNQDATTLSPAGAAIAQGPSEGGHGSGTRPNYFTTTTGTRIPLPAAACAPAGGGGGQPHNNLQPYLAMTWCIAVSGVFPPRT
jgi:microcystin-dependent protein